MARWWNKVNQQIIIQISFILNSEMHCTPNRSLFRGPFENTKKKLRLYSLYKLEN